MIVPQQAIDRTTLLSLEDPINDLEVITGILFSLSNDKLEKLGDVTFTEAEAGHIHYMIRMAKRKAEEVRRLYYREEAA